MLQLAMHHVDSALGVGSSRARVSVSVFEVYNEELFVLLDETGVKKTRLQRPMSDFHATKPMIMTSGGYMGHTKARSKRRNRMWSGSSVLIRDLFATGAIGVQQARLHGPGRMLRKVAEGPGSPVSLPCSFS